MRLRRENGDFDFTLKADGTATIPKNLFPEQLVGQIVVIRTNGDNDVYAVITGVKNANGADTYQFVVGSGALTVPLTYTVATGEVTIDTSSSHQG